MVRAVVLLTVLSLLGLACGGDGEEGLRLVFYSDRDRRAYLALLAEQGEPALSGEEIAVQRTLPAIRRKIVDQFRRTS